MSSKVLMPAIVALMAAGPGWASEGDASRGAAYAGAMCAACHSIAVDAAASSNAGAAPLRDLKLESSEALEKFFNTTHPSTGRGLKETQAADIFSFIQSLKAQGERH